VVLTPAWRATRGVTVAAIPVAMTDDIGAYFRNAPRRDEQRIRVAAGYFNVGDTRGEYARVRILGAKYLVIYRKI
jgi:hypothetical protein